MRSDVLSSVFNIRGRKKKEGRARATSTDISVYIVKRKKFARLDIVFFFFAASTNNKIARLRITN